MLRGPPYFTLTGTLFPYATCFLSRKWKMTLTPKAEPLAEKLRDIALYGRGIELRCIETRPVEGDIQRTLLAGAARTAHEINSVDGRSEEHTAELPSLMRNLYAVFILQKNKTSNNTNITICVR